jgi:hypothetical protein
MFPRRKDKFVAWSRAMVEGATVDKPTYPGGKKSSTRTNKTRTTRKRRKRRKNAKKE